MDYVGLQGERASADSYSYIHVDDNSADDGSDAFFPGRKTPNGGLDVLHGPYEYLDLGAQAAASATMDAKTLEDFLSFMGNEASTSLSFPDNSIFELPGGGAASSQSGADDVLEFADGSAPLQASLSRRTNGRTEANQTLVGGAGHRRSSLVSASKGAASTAAAASATCAARQPVAAAGARRKSSQQDISGTYEPLKDFGYSRSGDTPATATERSPHAHVANVGNRRPTIGNSGATVGQFDDDVFAFGIDAYLHGSQLGFGRQPSFKRVEPDAARIRDYSYSLGISDDPIVSSAKPGPTTHAAAQQRRSDAGLSTSATAGEVGAGGTAGGPTALTTTEALRNWFDAYPFSPMRGAGGGEAGFSPVRRGANGSPPPDLGITPVVTAHPDISAINEDFRREIDLLVKNFMNSNERPTDGGADSLSPQNRPAVPGHSRVAGGADAGLATKNFVGFDGSAAFPRAPLGVSPPPTSRHSTTTKEPVKVARPLAPGLAARSPAVAASAQSTPGGGKIGYFTTPAVTTAVARKEATPNVTTPRKRRQTWETFKTADQAKPPSGASPAKPSGAKRAAASPGRVEAAGKTATPAPHGREGVVLTGSSALSGEQFPDWDDAWLRPEGLVAGTAQTTPPRGAKSAAARSSSPHSQGSESLIEAWADIVPVPVRAGPTAAIPGPRAAQATAVTANTRHGTENKGGGSQGGGTAGPRWVSLMSEFNLVTPAARPPPPGKQKATDAGPPLLSQSPRPLDIAGKRDTETSSSRSSMPPTLREAQQTSAAERASKRPPNRVSASTESGRLPRLPRATSVANSAAAAVPAIVPVSGRYHTSNALRPSGAATTPGDTATRQESTGSANKSPSSSRPQRQHSHTNQQSKGGPLLEPLASTTEPENRVPQACGRVSSAASIKGAAATGVHAEGPSQPAAAPSTSGGAVHRTPSPRSNLGKPSVGASAAMVPTPPPSTVPPHSRHLTQGGAAQPPRRPGDETEAHIDFLLFSVDCEDSIRRGTTSTASSAGAAPASFPKRLPVDSTRGAGAPPGGDDRGPSSTADASPPTGNAALPWSSKKPTSILQGKSAATHPDTHSSSLAAHEQGNRRGGTARDRGVGISPMEKRHSASDNSVPATPSVNRRRRLSEFKTGGYWYPSFSKSKGSLPDQAGGGAAASAASRVHSDAEKEAQKANEERKQRIQAFMARRKAEKEKERQQKLLERDAEEAKGRRHSDEMAATPCQPGSLASESIHRSSAANSEVASSGERLSLRSSRRLPPGSKRNPQTSPAVAYLPTDMRSTATPKRSGKGSGQGSARRELNVRTVVLFVPSQASASGAKKRNSKEGGGGGTDALRCSVNVTPREHKTLEVQLRREPPLFFNVDEYLEYAGEAQLRLPSSVLLELNRRFFSGMNGAVLLASTSNARQASGTSLRHVVESVVMHLAPRSELFMSMSLIRNGHTEDLLLLSSLPAGTTLPRTKLALKVMPLVGMTLDDVSFAKITGAAQVHKLVSAGYRYAAPHLAAGEANDGMVVMSMVLKQLTVDGDVVVSSLLITDVATYPRSYQAVMQRAERSPYQLFHGALGGPSFTVALFCASADDESTVVPLLSTQNALSAVVNRQTHIGSIRRFVTLVEKELRNHAGTPAAETNKHKKLKEQLELGKSTLSDPVNYKPGDTPEFIAQRLQTKQSPCAIGSTAPPTLPRPFGQGGKDDNRPANVASSASGDSVHANARPVARSASFTSQENRDSRPARNHEGEVRQSRRTPLPSPSLPQPLSSAGQIPSTHSSSTPAPRPVPPADPSAALSVKRSQPVAAVDGAAPTQPIPADPLNTVTTAVRPLTKAGKSGDGGDTASSPTPDARRKGTIAAAGSGRYLNRDQKSGDARAFIQLGDEDSAVAKPPPPPPPQAAAASLRGQAAGSNSKSSRAGRGPAAPRSLPATSLSLAGRDEAEQRPSGSGRFLPGAAAIGINGPSWPSAPKLVPPAPPEVAPGRSREDELTANSISSFRESSRATTRKDGPATPQSMIPPSTKVRTLALIDPRCSETSNVTYDNFVVIATGEDDFEEYEVDEVSEVASGSSFIVSDVLQELCSTVLMGCNAAILGADSRSYAVSALVLKSVVRTILQAIADGGGSKYGSLTASIVKLKGETVVDLLGPRVNEPQKLFIAISPIFGSCVHGVEYRPVTDIGKFEDMLDGSLERATENGRDHGLVFASLILKLRVPEQDDVVVCSLVASFAGENVGLYTSVLDRSPLVPRALYHYALGGPCYTVALLGIGGDETRANQMLQVQHRLGEISNRPTHPGSIVKFIQGIRQDLQPALTEKRREAVDAEERATTDAILVRLEEMIRDAEVLLKDFEHHEPKAYLHAAEEAAAHTPISVSTAQAKQSRAPSTLHKASISPNAESGREPRRRALPQMTLKAEAPTNDEALRVKSLVCFDQRLLGGGGLAVEGNSVLVSTAEGGKRFDSDEVIVRDGDNVYVPDARLIDELVFKFATGHNTGLLAADSGNCAFTPLVLRKVVYQVIGAMQAVGGHAELVGADGERLVRVLQDRPIHGELQVSMALVKDNITADLLPVEADAPYHDFEIEHSPVFGPRIAGVTSHFVNCAEDFDRFLAVAIDNADPALQTADPGIMVVSLILTQQLPNDEVFVSSMMCTTVFDAVHHYFNVLDRNPVEPLELFRNILSGAAFTVAMVGVSDEDTDSVDLLNALWALSRVVNRPAQPNSVSKHIRELQDVIAKLAEHAAISSNPEDKKYNMQRMEVAQWMLQNAEALKRHPLTQQPGPEQERRAFVPLGAPEMTSGSTKGS